MTAAMAEVLTTGQLLDVIRHTADHTPRNLQKAVGPSGVGQPCSRRLVLDMLAATRHNTTADTWPSTIGTAVHAWLADAFTADNARRMATGRPPRWLIEQRVTVRIGLTGSCDLYDLQTNTVVDWKVLGAASLNAKRRAEHPGPQYQQQGHLYGMGWANAGLPVRTVAIVALPRSGILRDAWMWSEPYQPDIARAALDRMDQLLIGANVAEHARQLPAYMRALDRDTAHCSWCPFWSTDRDVDPSDGCAGPLEDPDYKEAPRQALSGIF